MAHFKHNTQVESIQGTVLFARTLHPYETSETTPCRILPGVRGVRTTKGRQRQLYIILSDTELLLRRTDRQFSFRKKSEL